MRSQLRTIIALVIWVTVLLSIAGAGSGNCPASTACGVLVESTESQGSGIVVTEGVLTAYHVVENTTGFDPVYPMHLADGRTVPGVLVRIDPAHDLALLAARGDLPAGMPVAEEAPGPGDEVWLVGSGLGFRNSVKRGVVANFERGVILLDLRVLPGDSGGGLVNEDGELAGVVIAVVSPATGTFTGYGIAVDTATLRAFLGRTPEP